ncbi:MAG TPA: putative quinol monooxygenase [Syntrophomonadaceae bacterium]|nr:putative quinol monooxygenase [Syntrophomonadaceae bacterium]HRX21059.1 putative quinol monooxygenase [Syntrophomonadaceae bacterium]
MLVCIAKFTAKAGMEQELQDHLTAFVPQVQGENGTLRYTVHRSKSRNTPGLFMFYEMYQDKEAFEYHSSTPYFQEFFGKIMPLVEGEPIIELYEDLASIQR